MWAFIGISPDELIDQSIGGSSSWKTWLRGLLKCWTDPALDPVAISSESNERSIAHLHGTYRNNRAKAKRKSRFFQP